MSEELSGEEIMRQNMAALDAGEEMPHVDESFEPENIQENTELEPEFNEESHDDVVEEIPEIAKKDGFMTKDEWIASGKDPDEYMTPEEFARVGELRDGDMTRQQLSKQLVQQQAVMKEILANQQKSIQDAANRAKQEALAELEAKKKEAIEYGDAEKAVELEREIIKNVTAEEPQEPEVNPVEQSMSQWYSKNDDWYGTHSGATDLLNVELKRAERQGLPFEDGIRQAEGAVKKQFGYLFGEQAQEKPKAPRSVSTQTRKPAKQSQKLSIKALPPEMQSIARTVIKKTGITEQEYMEQYNG